MGLYNAPGYLSPAFVKDVVGPFHPQRVLGPPQVGGKSLADRERDDRGKKCELVKSYGLQRNSVGDVDVACGGALPLPAFGAAALVLDVGVDDGTFAAANCTLATLIVESIDPCTGRFHGCPNTR